MDQHSPRNRPQTRQLVLGFALVTLMAILMISRIVTDRCNCAGCVVGEGVRKIAAKIGSHLQEDLRKAAEERTARRAQELAISLAHLQENGTGEDLNGLLEQLASCGLQKPSRYVVVNTAADDIEADSRLSGGKIPGPVGKAVFAASDRSVRQEAGPVCMIARTAGQIHYVAAAPIPGGKWAGRAACVVVSDPGEAVVASVPSRMKTMAQTLSGFVQKELVGVKRGISGLSSIVVTATVLLLCVAAWLVVRNEQVLAESEQRYRELVENALVSVVIYRNGRLSFVNRRVTELLGYDAEELIGRPITSIIHPDDRATVLDRARRRENGQEISPRAQFRFVTKDGDVLWGDVRSRCLSGRLEKGVIANIIDVTQRRRAQQRLLESEQKFRTFTEKSLHPIWVIQDGRIVYCNSAFAFYVGIKEPAEAIGMALQQFIEKRNVEDVKKALECVTDGQAQYQRLLVRFRTVHDSIRWHDIQFARIEYESEPAILASGQDVTELKLVMEELDQQRLRDGLTGLYNRRYFKETILDDPDGVCGDGEHMTVLSVDVDRLKAVNDTFGHAAGDIVLEEVGNVLTSQVREADTVIRVGGDEFIVIMPERTADEALSVEGRLQGALRNRLRERAKDSDLDAEVASIVGLSGGVASFADPGDQTIEETLREADRRMYARKDAKKAARDTEDLQVRKRRAG